MQTIWDSLGQRSPAQKIVHVIVEIDGSLYDTDSAFDFLCRQQGNITQGKDVIVDDWLVCLIVFKERMLVRDLHELVAHNLTGARFNAVSQRTSQEFLGT